MIFDNANPTILDTSELASHRERRKNKNITETEETVMDILMDKDISKIDPFYSSEYPDFESDSDDSNTEPIDEQEIYDLIAPISDPEHPLSLESLGVVKLQDVHLSQIFDHLSPVVLSHVLVELTPTVTHCSLATVIGLGVRVRLEQALPPSYRVEVKIKKDTHSQAEEVSKQLADKERVAAALENENLLGILKKMMRPCLDKSEI
ncbi:MIP18 family protein [Erysiphe neolycopersici]|uniref:MIP18 family protein n=1 Tax=Erysiphe neolycopersici TaxID=212602 RepID=A0A420I0I8_9PEZI|nr:MIP18 family protein [Erysiphe neolycopersici]